MSVLIISGSGFRLYFTPTVSIRIEINPSVGLGLNRFDRVISVDGYNEDGERLTASLDLKYLDYEDALNQILEDEDIVRMLAENKIMTISVAGNDEGQCTRVLSNVQSCTENHKNIHCYSEGDEYTSGGSRHGSGHGHNGEHGYSGDTETETSRARHGKIHRHHVNSLEHE